MIRKVKNFYIYNKFLKNIHFSYNNALYMDFIKLENIKKF